MGTTMRQARVVRTFAALLALVCVGATWAGQPDLTFTTPTGWSAPLVVSTHLGDTLDSSSKPPYSNNQTLYVDMAIINSGQASAGPFALVLEVDGVAVQTVPVAGLTTNSVFKLPDVNIGMLAVGPHTIRMLVDAGNVIQESIESNNIYVKNEGSIIVSPPTPNLTFTTPAGWSGPIVVSTMEGNNLDSASTPPYATDANLYVDLAVLNNGTADAGPFDVVLEIDGVEEKRVSLTGLALTPTAPATNPYKDEDINIGTLSRGTHVIRLRIDLPAPGSVTEFDDSGDNEYLRTLEVLYPQPTITSGSTDTCVAGSYWNSYLILAGPAVISYNAADLPPWASVNVSTGQISGTPPLTEAGPATTQFVMRVSAANEDFMTFKTVTVTVYPAPPTITSALQVTARLGLPFTYTLTYAGSPSLVSITPIALAGLVVNNEVISGTPDQSGTVHFTLKVTNTAGQLQQIDLEDLKIVIAGPPVFTSPLSGVSGTVGQGFLYQIGATGTPFFFSHDTNPLDTLPPGLTLNSSSGLISGTPTVSGTYTVPLFATGVGGSGTATLTVGIRDGAKPAITSPMTIYGMCGAPIVLPFSDLPDYFFYYAIQATPPPSDTNWWWVGEGSGEKEVIGGVERPSGWQRFAPQEQPPKGATRLRYDIDVSALPPGMNAVEIVRCDFDDVEKTGRWPKVKTGELTGKPENGTKGIWPVAIKVTYRDIMGVEQSVTETLKIIMEGPLPHILESGISKATAMQVELGAGYAFQWAATNAGMWFGQSMPGFNTAGYPDPAPGFMQPTGLFVGMPGGTQPDGHPTPLPCVPPLGLFWHMVWNENVNGTSLEIDPWPYAALAVCDTTHSHVTPGDHYPPKPPMAAHTVYVGVEITNVNIGAGNAINYADLQSDGVSPRPDGLVGLPNPSLSLTEGVSPLSVIGAIPGYIVAMDQAGNLGGIPTRAGTFFIRVSATGTLPIPGNIGLQGVGMCTLRVEHLKANQPVITSPDVVIGKLDAPFTYQFTLANATDALVTTVKPYPAMPPYIIDPALVLPVGLKLEANRITGRISPTAQMVNNVIGPLGDQTIQIIAPTHANHVAVFGMTGGQGVPASGTITLLQNPLLNDSITIYDTPVHFVTFTFGVNVTIAANPYLSLLNLATAIGYSTLQISVVTTSATPTASMTLQNDVGGTDGNQPMSTNAPLRIQVVGMAGGYGIAATGQIIFPVGNPTDGNRITIDDGFGRRVTFEFDVNPSNGVTPGYTRVVIDAANAYNTLLNLVDAIAASGLQITTTSTSNAPVSATLQNNNVGAQGNKPISVWPINGVQGVSSLGMGGGQGGAQASGTIMFPLGVPVNGDTVVLNDGAGHVVTFQFNSNPIPPGGDTRVAIVSGNSYATMLNLVTAIGASPLQISVVHTYNSPPGMSLVNNSVGPQGNQAIVSSNPTVVQVTGMLGGRGLASQGSVTILNGVNPSDGLTVTIGDGITVVVFEFDVGNGVRPGNTQVLLSPDGPFVTIANLCAAVNGNLGITAVSPPYTVATQSVGPLTIEVSAITADPTTGAVMLSNVFNDRVATTFAAGGHDTSTRYNFALTMVFYDQAPDKPTLSSSFVATASELIPFQCKVVGTQNAKEITALSVPCALPAAVAPLNRPRDLNLGPTTASSVTIAGIPEIGSAEFYQTETMRNKDHWILFQLKNAGADGILGNADDKIGFGTIDININPTPPLIQPTLDVAATFGFSNTGTRVVRNMGLGAAATVGFRLAHPEFRPGGYFAVFDYLVGTPQAGGGWGAGMGQSRDKDGNWDRYLIAPFEANHGGYYFGYNLPGGLSMQYSGGVPNTLLNTSLLSGELTLVQQKDAILAVQSSYGADTRVIAIRSFPVTITSSITDTAIVGVNYSYQITATGEPNDYWADGLPPGLSINPRTGIISGIPLVPSDSANPLNPVEHFEITIYASNPYDTGSQSLCLSVAQIDKTPVIVDPLKAAGREDFLATGVETEPFYGSWVVTRSFVPPDGPYYPPPGALLRLTNKFNGPGGNQDILTNNPGLIVVQGMSGGAWTSSGPPPVPEAPATGWIGLGGQNPADSNTVTISDGIQPVVFEFDVGNGVGGTNTAVAIDLAPHLTLQNLTDAIAASALQLTPVLDQSGGYRITVSSAPPVPTDPTHPAVPLYPPVTYSALSLPQGLSLDEHTGIISGVPIGYGNYNTIITATNIYGVGGQLLHIKIGAKAPQITSTLDATGVVGVPFKYTIRATGSQPLNLEVDAATLPPGITANGAILSGTPTRTATDPYTRVFSVKIRAWNSGGEDNRVLRITIYTRPTISSALTASGLVGELFSYTVTATGSPEQMVISAVMSIPGLSFDGTTISGMPTAANIYNVSLQVTNIATIRDADGTPHLDPAANVVLVITINQLTILNDPLVLYGTVGVPLTPFQIAATGVPPGSYWAYPLPQGVAVNSATGVIAGFPVVAGTFPVSIGATNGPGEANAILYLVIASADGAPAILPPLTAAGYVGSPQPFTYQIATTVPANSFDAVPVDTTITLASLGLHLSHANDPNDPGGNDGLLIGTPTQAGSFEILISASNAVGTGTAILVIGISENSDSPAIISPLHAQALVGAPFHYLIEASNGPTGFDAEMVNGDGLASIGLNVNTSTGQLSGHPLAAGDYDIWIEASNGTGTGGAILQLEVLPASPPIITSPGASAGVVGVPFWYVVTAPYATSYDAANLPIGLIMDASTGLISGTPLLAGMYNATVSATNMYGTTTAPLAITIVPAPGAPVITSPLTASGLIATPFSYQIVATNNPTNYNARPMPPETALPPGLSINSGTGVLSGTPSAPGTYNVILIATNAAGMGTAQLVVSIASPFPILTSPPTWTGTVGMPFGYQITATGTPPIAYSITGLPAGLTLNGSLISGTPTAATPAAGTTVYITATNSVGTTITPITIIILPPVPPVITSPLTLTTMVGVATSYTITTTGSQPITLGAANLPPGLTYANGVISGSPTQAFASPWPVTLTATNSVGSDTETLWLTILPLLPNVDTDGDGFPDELEILLGTNPLDPNSTPFNGAPGVAEPFHMPQPKLSIKLNFAKPNSDSVSLTGTLPVPAGFTSPGQTVVLSVGGIVTRATLDGKGGFVSADRRVAIKVRTKNKPVGQNAKYSMKLKGSFQVQLSDEGLTNETLTKARREVGVMVLFLEGQIMYQKVQTVLYTAKQGKTGMAK